MAKDRNIPKKTRFQHYRNYSAECERFSNHKRRMGAEFEVTPPKQHYRRKKKKPISLVVQKWWFGKDYVLGRYERIEDAMKAKKAFEKQGWYQRWYKDHLIVIRMAVGVEENTTPTRQRRV